LGKWRIQSTDVEETKCGWGRQHLLLTSDSGHYLTLDLSLSIDYHIRQSILSILLRQVSWYRRLPMSCPSLQCLSRPYLSR